MGGWQGKNYEEIEPPDDPQEASTEQRRAVLYREIKELGHPSLFDADRKKHFSRKFDISYRQVHYDLDAIAEFVNETIDLESHLTDVSFVFDKAMREAIDEGNWQEAADIAEQQAEWLERRGIIDNEQEQNVNVDVESDWREFLGEEE